MPLNAIAHPFLSPEQEKLPQRLGINGLGRIGKMTLWHHVARQTFEGLVVNVGREVGKCLQDIASYLEQDSTYGSLSRFLHGYRGGRVIEELDEGKGTMRVNGLPVIILRQDRNPKDIGWNKHGVKLVIDSTGVFRDPTVASDTPKGSLRGHLEAGAEKVILSAPFKIKDKSKSIPGDALTAIQGINDTDYDPQKHRILSAASCTTTCLAFMMRGILDHFGPKNILGASMVTVHATTASQKILDSVPGAGSDDLRKTRSLFNNIILTTTGAADALGQVIPEIKDIGFTAESVRISTNTGSIVVLVLNIQDERPDRPITREAVNEVYRDAAEGYLSSYVTYSDRQNVSSDIIGTTSAVVIEGRETRARTATIKVNLTESCRLQGGSIQGGPSVLEVPITQVVVYGWYDNELGCFSNMLGELTLTVARGLS